MGQDRELLAYMSLQPDATAISYRSCGPCLLPLRRRLTNPAEILDRPCTLPLNLLQHVSRLLLAAAVEPRLITAVWSHIVVTIPEPEVQVDEYLQTAAFSKSSRSRSLPSYQNNRHPNTAITAPIKTPRHALIISNTKGIQLFPSHHIRLSI